MAGSGMTMRFYRQVHNLESSIRGRNIVLVIFFFLRNLKFRFKEKILYKFPIESNITSIKTHTKKKYIINVQCTQRTKFFVQFIYKKTNKCNKHYRKQNKSMLKGLR